VDADAALAVAASAGDAVAAADAVADVVVEGAIRDEGDGASSSPR
jgi:hypothetical protein